jgi:hypothetical protein
LVKQQQSATEKEEKKLLPGEEPINAELLLRSHTLTERFIHQARQINNESGLELDIEDYWGVSSREAGPARKRVKTSKVFVQYEDSVTKKQKLKWLSSVTNVRSGAFYSLNNLIQSGVIAESERELFDFSEAPPGTTDYPYRFGFQFMRIKKADGSEWLNTAEMWYGITRSASVVNIYVPDVHHFIKPAINYEYRNSDGSVIREGQSIVDNKTVRVALTRTAPNGDVAGTKTHTTPFSAEVAYSALKIARGSVKDPYNGHSLMMISEGAHNPISVKDHKLWAEAPFDELWSELTKPTPQINIDSHDLLNYLKSSEGSKNKDAYQ